MVKVDPKRNYYADLEIPQNACTEDIKKQFRKLARLYHPDRNPGKEAEFVPKFQAIQAAHEVLGDPDQRAKYDADRKKLGYSAKPTRPPFASAHTTAGRPAPTARNSVFGAQFGQRPHTSAASARAQQPPNPPPRPNAPPHPTRPNPAWYNPSQQPSSPYTASNAKPTPSSTPRGSRFSNMRPPPSPRAPTHSADDPTIKSNVFTAWQHMAPGQRSRPGTGASTPGASTPGSEDERRARDHGPFGASTASAGPGMRRSNTTKTTRKAGFNPNLPGDFWEPPATRTSSYTTRHSFAAPGGSNPSSDNSGPSRDEESAKKAQHPRERHSDHGLRATASAPQGAMYGERLSTPYQSSGGEKLNPNKEDIRRSASARDPRLSPRYVPDETSPGSNGTPRAKSASDREPSSSRRRPPHPTVVDLSSDSSDSEISPSEPPVARRFAKPASRLRGSPSKRPTQSAFPVPSPPARGGRAHNSDPEQRPSINTEFSSGSETFKGVFEGSNGFTSRQNITKNGRPRISPTRGQAPLPDAFRSIFPELPTGIPVTKPATETPQEPVKFKAEEWEKTFKQPSLFVPDPSKLGSQTSRPASSNGKKVHRRRPISFESLSDDEKSPKPRKTFDPSSEESATSRPSSKDDADAMDIDMESSPPATGPKTSEHRNVRNVTMPTNRPEWGSPFNPRASTSNPSAIPMPQQDSFSQVPTAVPHAMPPPPPPPPGPPPSISPISPTSIGQKPPMLSSDHVPPALNLSDMRQNLESRTPTGVADLKELSSTLPFDSKPSEVHPNAPPNGPLNIPGPPNTPSAPSARRLSQPQWKQYVSQMSVYMGEWYIWDGRILQHLSTRHNDAAKFGTGLPSTQGTALLEARGDVKAGGIERWGAELEQDRRVRDFWAAACNKHQKCVREFIAVKKRVASEGLLPA